MASYVIGDLQGCFEGLLALLSKLGFRKGRDRLLFCGDLVARGPDSLETLRFVSGLGPAVVSVLGNHDLHLLSLAERGERGDPDDHLDAVLQAPDADRLLHWLRRQRLAYRDPRHSVLLIHAGLAPQWTQRQTLQLAAEVQHELREPRRFSRFMSRMYGNEPNRWSDRLRGAERMRCIVNILTRARYCDIDGHFDYRYKGPIDTAPAGLLPWFAAPDRRSARSTVIFGHWSALGRVHWPANRVYGLDTGYLWGGHLTALRLDDRRLFSVAATTATRSIPRQPA
ncbi:symmetrical bis(5'-nucleosyl)-tetraphosphatase [Solimonas terrae]|uniref:Bis(5'-nucleosyl)-tetraphosphatase, symmetrical n=1 Tax=Solimonas terrae TaxID=1396819 RepID=A0A6M2BSH4_9GAMM|nr:symmetrical bis(5'-nucleosyl)-tetraphosphatase [Solimonas terrae]NGY05280.1 symmetrical bis(5'-nucleosyl)-tetraphosphatase [Solimonas terrae]